MTHKDFIYFWKAVNIQTDRMLGELQKENTMAVVTSEMYVYCIAVKYIVASSLDCAYRHSVLI